MRLTTAYQWKTLETLKLLECSVLCLEFEDRFILLFMCLTDGDYEKVVGDNYNLNVLFKCRIIKADNYLL